MRGQIGVLVLGRSGMLGSTVFHRLRRQHTDWCVEGTEHGAGSRMMLVAEAGRPGLTDLFRLNRYHYVVNCIGVLKSAIDEESPDSVQRAIRVNALFPHEVADAAEDHGAKVIHVSTDAVFSGRQPEPYTEKRSPDPADVYGMTKALGECPRKNVLNVRCSVVGRDQRHRGLVEWYLASRAQSVVGYDDYVWTPVTTLQFADWCSALIASDFDDVRAGGHLFHLALNPPLSKADFLQALRDAVGDGPAIDRRSNPDGPCFRVLLSHNRAGPAAPAVAIAWPTLLSELLTEFSSRRDL